MIIYKNTKKGFFEDCRDNLIANKVEHAFSQHNLSHNNMSEFMSWANSLQYMRNVLDDNDIPMDCNLAIEYQIPLTSKRVDFLIDGLDEFNNKNIVVIELKQWEKCEMTKYPSLVMAYTGGANRLVNHPSYQAYAYASTIRYFNEEVYNNNINLVPCAFLHNYLESYRYIIENDFYDSILEEAPVFLHNDTIQLRSFIKRFIKKSAGRNLLYEIDNGKIKPAKALHDALSSMLKGNKEYQLLDEQKNVYEIIEQTILDSNIKIEDKDKKQTIIVQGGPGTGKSVIAINLLTDLIRKGYSALYVTKNAAPRHVYFEKLKQDKFKFGFIKSLFVGSGSFVDSKNNEFNCLIVDEAHRLQMKSGMFQNLGEAQIKEIIHAAKTSIFFIDEDQIVTTSDVGSIELIKKYALEENSEIIYNEDLKLVSQFRCNGSDGYIAFLDNLLEIRETANYEFDIEDFDVKVFDNPNTMRDVLREKNKMDNKARMLAGYCYNWISKNDYSSYDINLKNDFKARWNLNNTNTWAIDEDSFEEVGCIHTSQGLEFNYVGVIIGKDLIYRNGHIKTNFLARAKTDQSLKGIKSTKNYDLADKIIRNTYKTLLTRGQKGCYIYCEDEELNKYISQKLGVEIIK